MKKHAIIPIFIPHLGCPEQCVFCDQRAITARQGMPTMEQARKTIDEHILTMKDLSPDDIEIAFYGGSFTGIPVELQEDYLGLAKEYMDRGAVSGIHLSTRPDYIDEDVLERLYRYGASVIELGVQSFDDEVLALSKRGHDSAAVYRACELIKKGEFRLGIQLMIGLPGDTRKKARFSAEETAAIKPDLARLYPTVVLPGTELYKMYEAGSYTPLSREEAVDIAAMMYRILFDSGIRIMRVGLKSTDIINNRTLGEINEGSYHPAFRQLVEGRIAREKIEEVLAELCLRDEGIQEEGIQGEGIQEIDGAGRPRSVTIAANSLWLSAAAGHGGENREYFKHRYPDLELSFTRDDSLPDGEFKIYH